MTQQTDAVDDPIGPSARAAAQRLASEHTPGLAADVEAALHAHDSPRQPEQYLDPISLAALIVSAAQLGWAVYTDLKTKTTQPSPQVIARRVRIELPCPPGIEPTDRERVIDIVIDETVRHAGDVDEG